MSAGALSRYESGRALPSLPTFDRLLATCGKDVRLVLVDRVDDLAAELARRGALPRRRRVPRDDWLRPSFLERLVQHDVDVLVAGAWAADLHGIPVQQGQGRLLLPDEPVELERAARAFMTGSVPWRATEGHYGSLPVRLQTFADHPVASWLGHDVGHFRTEVLAPTGDWPFEQRLQTPAGPLRVVVAATLGEQDGVAPEVLAAWQAWREQAGPDVAPW